MAFCHHIGQLLSFWKNKRGRSKRPFHLCQGWGAGRGLNADGKFISKSRKQTVFIFLESSCPTVNKLSAFIKCPWYLEEISYHILCPKLISITAFRETSPFTARAGVR